MPKAEILHQAQARPLAQVQAQLQLRVQIWDRARVRGLLVGLDSEYAQHPCKRL